MNQQKIAFLSFLVGFNKKKIHVCLNAHFINNDDIDEADKKNYF
jgi:hypothetical protein